MVVIDGFDELQDREDEEGGSTAALEAVLAATPPERHNNKLVCPVLLARALPHLHKTLRHHPHGGGEFLGRPSSRSLHIVPPRHAVVPRRRGEVVDMYVDGGSTRLHWRSRG